MESFIQEVIDDSETSPEGGKVGNCVVIEAGVGTKKNKEKGKEERRENGKEEKGMYAKDGSETRWHVSSESRSPPSPRNLCTTALPALLHRSVAATVS
jgi:hypothetical protein